MGISILFFGNYILLNVSRKSLVEGIVVIMGYIFVGIGVGMFNVFFVVILYYNIINIWIFYYLGSFFILLFFWMGCDNEWNILKCFYRLLIMI